MRANCWHGTKSVQVEEVPDPTILNARDAIVRITSTAICGSDLHLYNGFIPSMKRGDVLGHEFMGEVVEVGSGVRNLKVGDRVVVPFPIACGHCAQCERDMFSLCENSNPNAWMPEKLWGHVGSGAFGYSHMTGWRWRSLLPRALPHCGGSPRMRTSEPAVRTHTPCWGAQPRW